MIIVRKHDLFRVGRVMYSEFFTTDNISSDIEREDFFDSGCDYCILPKNYTHNESTKDHAQNKCKFCSDFKKIKFSGGDKLLKDINLQGDEKIGVMVSGGKDSIYAWSWLVEKLGSNRVIALNHRKVGVTHPIAIDNLSNAQNILKSDLVVVEDFDFYTRFIKNIDAFLNNPTPEMVRVALCVGCRYGITENLYKKGLEMNIHKFVSAASYLELAPFKNELMTLKGKGNKKYGLICSLAENKSFNFDDNIEMILRDDNYEYKSNKGKAYMLNKGYELFDMDNYFENIPEKIEKYCMEKLKWNRPNRSWHFDCLVEHFKDVFYYGLMGYTESDFKLSTMVRYNYISREDAIKEIKSVRNCLKNSFNDTCELLVNLNIEYFIPKLKDFYQKSIYLENVK